MRLEGGCPGRDGRVLKAEERPCPECGYAIEFFSDEGSRRCPSCRTTVRRDAPLSCAQWCSSAGICAAARAAGAKRDDVAAGPETTSPSAEDGASE